MKPGFSAISKLIDSYESQMVGTMCKMIPIKAISPKSAGQGESRRADFLEKTLKSWGLRTRRYDYRDDTGAKRSNVVTVLGNLKRTIWFVGHIDTVSEGDLKLWNTDPFVAKVRNGRIYGRGAEDNGQGVISSMYALKALKESNAKLKYNFGLALVADEEVGSRFGMQKLMNEGIFKKSDMFMVPDSGVSDGSVIEIGEKGMLWLKVTVKGKQAHASIPDEGKNAFRYSIRFLNEVDLMLHSKYKKKNPLFHPAVSTFEMTKHEKNVDSVNIIPGSDVSYIDSRVLPQYKLDNVISDIKGIAKSSRFKEVKIEIETFNREDCAPITSPDSEIVRLLGSSIKELRGIKPVTEGIGGGTCAAFARKAGMDAAVWVTNDDIAHTPNEYCKITNLVNDAKVFARMLV